MNKNMAMWLLIGGLAYLLLSSHNTGVPYTQPQYYTGSDAPTNVPLGTTWLASDGHNYQLQVGGWVRIG